jgi:hypothetical protein
MSKAIIAAVLPLIAMSLSKLIQSPSSKFRCIKKIEVKMFKAIDI